MKKIVMTKYGFERWPENDFTDDGTKFTCYKVGKRVRVSKTTSKGEAFISACITDIKVPYTEYSKLHHYAELDELNGVLIDPLTDEDLLTFYNACLEYEREVTELENNIKYPSLDEIIEQCKKVQARAELDLMNAKELFESKAIKAATTLSRYAWNALQDYFMKLVDDVTRFDSLEKIETYAYNIHGTSTSFTFCSSTNRDLQKSFCRAGVERILESI